MSKITTIVTGVTFPSGFKLPAATQEPEHRASAEWGEGYPRLFWNITSSRQCTDRYEVSLLRPPLHSCPLACGLDFLVFVTKSGCLSDPSVKLFKAKLQSNVWYPAVAVLLAGCVASGQSVCTCCGAVGMREKQGLCTVVLFVLPPSKLQCSVTQC